MIDNSIESLFKEIDNSLEYKEYKEIEKILKENKEVMNLIDEIKTLEKEATKLEYENNPKYKEIDNIIKDKVKSLEDNSSYKEYQEKLRKFNEVMRTSSLILQEYIDDKVSI